MIYAANWDSEYKEIKFWDELDFVGIQAYFPLSNVINPATQDLETQWKPIVNELESFHNKVNKPIIFTEIGYKSTSDAAIKPWEWPSRFDLLNKELSHETQVNCYNAFFNTFWNIEWFHGVHFWEWYPKHNKSGGMKNYGFTPQNKPAQKIISNWFSK